MHGNAQNISTHIGAVAWLPAEGFDVLLFDYRGYGSSEGTPSLGGLQHDFEAALALLLDSPELDAGPVVVFGQSLGAAVAITGLAASPERDRVAGLVIEGGCTSYRDVAREKLAGLWLTWPLQWPLALTIDDRYRPIDVIGALAPMPVLVIHGEADQVVPVHHGQALFDAVGRPKGLWLIPDTGHIQAVSHPEVRTALADWLNGIVADTEAPAAKVHLDEAKHEAQRSDAIMIQYFSEYLQ